MQAAKAGFTLIEMSIVLVIIGLIVGGVLVGQDLIRASYIRATITQVEQFNTGVNTFYGKYGALPGDMNASVATAYGFATLDSGGNGRGYVAGGDGNGLIDGMNFGGASTYPNNLVQFAGETAMFWSDLTYAGGMNINLIPGSFGNKQLYFICNVIMLGSYAQDLTISDWLGPVAKLGAGNYFYPYESGGTNYYGLSYVSGMSATLFYMQSTPALTALQAYKIDAKLDDGIANTGNVQANYVGYSGNAGAILSSPSATAGSYTNTTCFDSSSGLYLTNWQNGNAVACGLSFKFQ